MSNVAINYLPGVHLRAWNAYYTCSSVNISRECAIKRFPIRHWYLVTSEPGNDYVKHTRSIDGPYYVYFRNVCKCQIYRPDIHTICSLQTSFRIGLPFIDVVNSLCPRLFWRRNSSFAKKFYSSKTFISPWKEKLDMKTSTDFQFWLCLF